MLGAEGARGGGAGGCTHAVHGRSRMPIDSRIVAMPRGRERGGGYFCHSCTARVVWP